VCALTVDEHVDVPADAPALVEDPSVELRMAPLERSQHGEDARARELVLGAPAGQLA
jgi:hypothetical protein